MAKPYRLPDFKKLYPETKDEIIAVLKISERKMQYQEYDLKNEQIVIDMQDTGVYALMERLQKKTGIKVTPHMLVRHNLAVKQLQTMEALNVKGLSKFLMDKKEK